MFTTAIISTLVGIFGGILPNIVDIFKSRQDTLNEIKLLDARTAYNLQASKLKVDELNVEADIAEAKSIYANDGALDGGKFVNAVRASVRPFITYVFFSVFIWIKIYAVYYGLHSQNLDVINIIPLVWDEETASIFSAVIGFWFGTRSIDKFYKRKAQSQE